jgi:predicted short-subunit dehydrogenase-like oxidoreductase (DUF2520 family)
MSRDIKISFIGSGNVAWHLAPALDNLGFVVKEVYSRNPRHAEALTERLYQAEVKASLDFSTSPSRLFIIATSDEAIADIAREIVLPDDAVLVHTSGSQPLDVLSFAATSHLGVFYPLQTFSKSKRVDWKSIPLFLESSDQETDELLMAVARGVSQVVRKIGSTERRALHVAAVFASNFINHMLLHAKGIMAQNSLQYEWLQPLILETIHKSLAVGPEAAQTGPARRGDLQTLDAHLAFLQDNEPASHLYRIISQQILDHYHEA